MRRAIAGLAILSAAALGLAGCGSSENTPEEPVVEEVVVEEPEEETVEVEEVDTDDEAKAAAEKAALGKPLSREEACAALAGENDDFDADDFDLDELDEMLENVLGEDGDFEDLIAKAKEGVKTLNNKEVADAMIEVLDAQAPFMAAMQEAFSSGNFDDEAVEKASAHFEQALEGLFEVCPNLRDLD